MKKIIITLFTIIILITGCTAKEKEASDLTIPEGATLPPESQIIPFETIPRIDFNTEGIIMTIKEGTLTPTSATVIIEDKTDKSHTFSNHLWICRASDNSMLNFKNGVVEFSDMIYTVNKNNKLEMNLSWEEYFGALEPNEYKLVKLVYSTEDDEYSYFSTDFTIN